MNDKELAELKRIKAILSAVTGLEDDDQEYIEDARKALQSIIAQHALDKMAESARELGLDCEPAPVQPVAHTYSSTQATMCACCGEHKHTPLRIDKMGGYVCLTCIDKKLGSLLGEFGYSPAQPAVQEQALGSDIVLDESLPPNTMKFVQPAPVQPVTTGKPVLHVEQLLNDMLDILPYNTPEYWMGRIKEVLPINTTPPAAQPAVQEPVGEVSGHDWSTGLLYRDLEPGTPLYTAPQPVPVKTYHDGKPWPVAPKPWAGLTDEERNECTQSPFTADQHRAIEAKLKEKNHDQ
jgi:hypothetical protein